MRLLCPALASSVLLLLAFAGTAAATDYCVTGRTGCTPSNTHSTIQSALTAAQGAGHDRVLIGAGEFTVPAGGLSYTGDRVDVIGAGADATILNQQRSDPFEYVLSVDDGGAAGGSTVEGLRAVIAQNIGTGRQNGGLHLDGAVHASHVDIAVAPAASGAIGVKLDGTSELTFSTVDLGYLPDGGTAVYASTTTADAPVVEDSYLRGYSGVINGSGGAAEVRRTEIATAGNGVAQGAGSVLVENVVITLEPLPGGVGTTGFYVTGAAGAASVDVRHVTVIGGDALSTGVDVDSSDSSASVINSIIRTPGISLRKSSSATSAIAANYNAFHPGATVENGGGGTFFNLNARLDNPQFLGDPDFGEFRLSHASPMIDAGNPAALASPSDDFDGDPRVVDGDGDGTARRDLGAFEYQRRAPVVTALAEPATAFPGDPIAWIATATDEDGDPLTYEWSWDDRATGSGASVAHAFTPLGSHTGTATVTDATGLTATASASATVVSAPVPIDPRGGGGGVVDRLAPVFSIVRAALRLSARNTVAVRLTCAQAEIEPCAGRLRLASTKRVARGRILQIGRAVFRIAAGRSKTVTVRVSSHNARSARRLRRFKVTATATAKDRAGNEAKKTLRGTLVAPRPRGTR